MKLYFYRYLALCLLVFSLSNCKVNGQIEQTKQMTLGAYYFDGWTGTYPQHLTPRLTQLFPERKPIWGWITSTQDIVDKQILSASGAGISFFSFCWYYSGKESYKTEPLNNALKLFNSSQHTNKMQFCLLVANHGKFSIGNDGWDDMQQEWIRLFKIPNYLKVDNKPLLILFSVPELVKALGSIDAVKTRLQSLRAAAQAEGLSGVTVAACVSPDGPSIKQGEDCGFDVLTGYNYHGPAIRKGTTTTVPIDTMQVTERALWNNVAARAKLPYIPVSTLSWDPRPWAGPGNNYETAPYFVGYSENSVYKSVFGMGQWMDANPTKLVSERLSLVYAWNENGEGAYLTPTDNGPDFLRGLKDAVDRKIK